MKPFFTISALASALWGALPAPRTRPSNSLVWYAVLGALSTAIAIGIWVAYRTKHEIEEDDVPASNDELLAELRQAYDQGQMDEAEFERVTQLLTGQRATSHQPTARPASTPPSGSTLPSPSGAPEATEPPSA